MLADECVLPGAVSAGAGVVLSAVLYAKETERIKAYVDAKIKCCKPAPRPSADEQESIVPP